MDFGWLIALGFCAFIIATMYKKKTGNNISELWKNREGNSMAISAPDYRRVYITKGIKQ